MRKVRNEVCCTHSPPKGNLHYSARGMGVYSEQGPMNIDQIGFQHLSRGKNFQTRWLTFRS